MRRLALCCSFLGLCGVTEAVHNPASAANTPAGKLVEPLVCAAIECLILDAPNGAPLKDAGKVTISNAVAIKNCKPEPGGTSSAQASTYNAYSTSSGTIVVNTDEAAKADGTFFSAFWWKRLMAEELHHARQRDRVAHRRFGLNGRAWGRAWWAYKEIAAKAHSLAVLNEHYGLDDPDVPQSERQEFSDLVAKQKRSIGVYGRRLKKAYGFLVKKLGRNRWPSSTMCSLIQTVTASLT